MPITEQKENIDSARDKNDVLSVEKVEIDLDTDNQDRSQFSKSALGHSA